MGTENDEYVEFSLSQKDTLIYKHIAEVAEPELPLATQIPKKTRLERLSLSRAATIMMWVVGKGHFESEASKQRMFSLWNFKHSYKYIMTDSLYKNSIFNMASTFLLGGLGFVFWIIIAHLYNIETVGIASTLISIMVLLSSFTIMGVGSSLIRYLPKSTNKIEFINTSFAVVTIATLLPSVIFLLILQVLSPHLLFLRSNIFYFVSFIIFTIFTSWNTLIESIFMAFRAADNILLKNTIISVVKLVLPFVLIAFGAYGIFASVASAFTVGVLFSLIILSIKFNIKFSISINFQLLKKHSVYSFANYIVVFMLNMPSLVLPIIILNILSAKYAAYFYIVSMMQNFLVVIPMATEQALLAEGSYHEAELKKYVIKAITTTAVILIPATVIIVLFGYILLQFFGQEYVIEAFQFLKLYSISTIFTALLLIANAVMNVKHKIKTLVILNILTSVLTLYLCYVFISGRLIGIGWGWILGQAFGGLVSIYIIIRNCSDTQPMPSVAKQDTKALKQ